MKKGETGISRAEQETLISFNETPEEATVYTINGRLLRRLREVRERDPRKRVFVRADEYGFEWWKVDKNIVTLTLPRTEEYKLARKESARKRWEGGKEG